MTVVEGRRPPWIWQSTTAMSTLRQSFTGQERTTAIALYVAMTEVANECRSREQTFAVPRARIIDYSGVSHTTFAKYVEQFAKLGLVAVERRGGDREVSLYTLLEPPLDTPPRVGNSVADVGKPVAEGSATQLPVNQEEHQEPPLTPPRGDGQGELQVPVPIRRPRSVRANGDKSKRLVTTEEWTMVEQILSWFNETFGTTFTSSNAKASSMIVCRLREWPQITLPEHKAMIERNARDPWWGSGKPHTVGVLYSPDSFSTALEKRTAQSKSTADFLAGIRGTSRVQR